MGQVGLRVSMGHIGSNVCSDLVILFKNHTNSYISQAFSFTYSSSPYESQQRLSGTEARSGWEESVATSRSSGVMALEVVINFEEFPKHHVPGSLWTKNEHKRPLHFRRSKSLKCKSQSSSKIPKSLDEELCADRTLSIDHKGSSSLTWKTPETHGTLWLFV